MPETEYAPSAWRVNEDVHYRFDERARLEAERRSIIRQLITGKADPDKPAYAREAHGENEK